MTAALRLMQRALEAQNGLAPQPSVGQFLLTEEGRARLSRSTVPEQIFVSDDPDDPQLGVFISKDVLARLTARVSLYDAAGLDAYCVATEGVSHFVYLAHRASVERQVSLLELELQAEVDKFVHLSGLLPARLHADLFAQLFDRYALREGLDAEDAERYHTASRAAAQFCLKLLTTSERLDRAREFFRLPLAEKLRRAVL